MVGTGRQLTVALLDAVRSKLSREHKPSDPDVESELQRRLQTSKARSLYGIIPLVVIVVVLFWSRSSHIGLLVWAAIISTNSIAWLRQVKKPINDAWMKWGAFFHITGAFSWGLLPILAMPRDPTDQVAVVAYLSGVIAANTNSSAPIKSMYYRFHMTLTITAIAGFLINSTGVGLWTSLSFLTFCLCYAAAMAEVNHATHREAAEFGVHNGRLAKGLATNKVQLEKANKRLDRQARTDSLTGIANRLGFTEALEKALNDRDNDPTRTVGLVYIDLDGFKVVNDTMGHRVGDLLLVAVARRLSNIADESELVARQGGDELVLLCPNLDDDRGIENLSQRLRSVFAEPFVIDNRQLDVAASCGIAVSDSATNADQLLRQADIAVYKSKVAVNDKVTIFDSEMGRQLAQDIEIEQKLNEALGSNQIKPYFQPIVDLSTGHIVGGEALVRWEHPDGIKTAAAFLDIAARQGLMPAIDQMVVASVSDFCLDTQARLPTPIRLTVNITANQLRRVLDTFTKTSALDGLTIEISQQEGFNSISEAQSLVEQAHSLGAEVLVDDFGLGRSSLAMATQLNVDGYKIDRSFVADIETEAAVAAIASVVELAARRGQVVIAEGVETATQMKLLRELGVETAQGDYYSPAVALDQFDRWLSNNHQFPTSQLTA